MNEAQTLSSHVIKCGYLHYRIVIGAGVRATSIIEYTEQNVGPVGTGSGIIEKECRTPKPAGILNAEPIRESVLECGDPSPLYLLYTISNGEI
ncbi:MAG: hypothetical protein M2R45_03080 [Verrucomicrobia subdivision 3 bacterium]|nr:hypothetical protein [Limisphaerales bacterium]MCS1416566.1 hypothetical protein [Limisphaerales bacterium]